MFLKFCIIAFAVCLSISLSEGAPRSGTTINFAIIADLDKKSISKKNDNNYKSIVKLGELYKVADKYSFSMKDEHHEVFTKYAYKGRGAELSEFLVYKWKLYTFDDKSGIVFKLKNNADLVPWVILANGDGDQVDGFKAEWATTKGDKMYVGSTGISWSDSTGKLNSNSLWIKEIDQDGKVLSLNWKQYYDKMKSVMKIPNGFIWHEAVNWSKLKNQWVLLPRKCSELPFDTNTEETIGCNKIIIASENFQIVRSIRIKGKSIDPAAGFSSFKFLPESDDQILIALKTIEKNGKTATYLTVIDITGRVLMPDKIINEDKFEGIVLLKNTEGFLKRKE
uniref:Apyrase n=1 Tax=Phlebotomus duboscqi TaxID=37738 RepID=Q06K73_PHLDU|nr:35.8 kDa salivary protein [Phlebotomus duboscqi]